MFIIILNTYEGNDDFVVVSDHVGTFQAGLQLRKELRDPADQLQL